MKTKLQQLFNLPQSGTPPVCLAPMAGFTDGAMRSIASRYNAALTATEMTSAIGLLHEGSKTWQLLERMEGEAPVMGHLYGSSPESLAEAARRVEERGGFAGIDLNAGCPVKKITKNGAGAALINSPQLIYEILAAMRQATSLPLTIKTRLGPHPGKIAIFEILQAAQDAGADAIIVHGRFTSQGHGGDPDLKLLGEVKARATIPVIGNGGIRSAWDGWQMFKETGVDGLMVARSAIGDPWIFEEIRAALSASEPPEVYDPTRGRQRRDLKAIRQVLMQHLDLQRELLERHHALADRGEGSVELERGLSVTFQCHLFRYLSGLKGSSYLRSHLRNLKTVDSIIAAIDGCLEREQIFRITAPQMR